jgi:hypothetical protein
VNMKKLGTDRVDFPQKKVGCISFQMARTCLLVLCLLTAPALDSCSNKAQFQKQIELMSDAELLSYYHGMNDQVRDIDRESRVNNHIYDQQQDWERGQVPPFFAGGRGYDLGQKRELVEKELGKRNLTP